MINGAQINGFSVNGSVNRGALVYASASILAGSTVNDSLSLFSSISSSLLTSVSIYESGYVAKFSFSDLNGGSLLSNTNTIVLRGAVADLVSTSSIADTAAVLSYAAAQLAGTSTVIAFQGDSVYLHAGASVNANNVGIGVGFKADFSGGSEFKTKSNVTRVLELLVDLYCNSNIDPVPSIIDGITGFYVHDGHSYISSNADMLLPPDVLRKELYTDSVSTSSLVAKVNSDFYIAAEVYASARTTIDPYLRRRNAFSDMSVKSFIDASPYLKKNCFSSISAESAVYDSAIKEIEIKTKLLGSAGFYADLGVSNALFSKIESTGYFDNNNALTVTIKPISSFIHAGAVTLANMTSNPRSRAIEKRTYYIPDDDRVVSMKEDNREIYLKAS